MPPFLVACVIAAGVAPQSSPQWANLITLPAGVQPTEGTLIEREFDEGVFTVGTVDSPKRGTFATGYLTRLPEGFHEPSDAAHGRSGSRCYAQRAGC